MSVVRLPSLLTRGPCKHDVSFDLSVIYSSAYELKLRLDECKQGSFPLQCYKVQTLTSFIWGMLDTDWRGLLFV